MNGKRNNPAQTEPGRMSMGTAPGRWVLAATVGGTGMAFLDGTVVNVALPTIGRELGGGLSGLQWVLNGYMLTLAALILLAGSLGDRYGRKRVFQIGVVGFALASAACAFAVNLPMLILARVAQGIGGALLTPGSLAIVEASFWPQDRGRAIGAWSGLTGIATAVGPLLGGWLIEAGSWRYIFLLNLPVAVAVVAVTARHVPESRDALAVARLDIAGAGLAVIGLGALTYALISAGERGLGPSVIAAAIAGAAALIGFAVHERRSPNPMLPPALFASRQFRAVNIVTVAVYAALGAVFFLLIIYLQVVMGYSPLAAGLAALPVTVLMLALSARSGQLAQRIGPRLQMTAGPLFVAAGVLLMIRIAPGARYVTAVLPAVVVFGFGLAVTVAPLTSAALASAAERYAGIASGVNNAAARTAQLTAVAVVPLAAGLTGDLYADPAAFAAGFDVAMMITAGLAAAGGILALATVRNPSRKAGEADVEAEAKQTPQARPNRGRYHCGLEAPPP